MEMHTAFTPSMERIVAESQTIDAVRQEIEVHMIALLDEKDEIIYARDTCIAEKDAELVQVKSELSLAMDTLQATKAYIEKITEEND